MKVKRFSQTGFKQF